MTQRVHTHTHQAITHTGQILPDAHKTEPLLEYTYILAHYQHEGRYFHAPHLRLTIDKTTILQRLQTNFHIPAAPYSMPFTPPSIPPDVTSALPPAPYTTWYGSANSPRTSLRTKPLPYEQCTTRLASTASTDRVTQQDLVKRARAASRSQGIPD